MLRMLSFGQKGNVTSIARPKAKAKSRITANTVILRQPSDLPASYEVISFSGERKSGEIKNAILLPENLHGKLCVLKVDAQHAVTIVSADIAEDPELSHIFSGIREQLAMIKVASKATHWATDDLVRDLCKVQSVNKADTQDSSEAEKNIHTQRFREICQLALNEGATDVHFESKANSVRIRARIDAELYPLNDLSSGEMMFEIGQKTMAHVFTWLLDDKSNSSSNYSPTLYLNGTTKLEKMSGNVDVKLRVQSNPTVNGPDMIIRFLNESASLTLEEIGYSEDQCALIRIKLTTRSGNIYVAGIPNSGKTTSTRAYLEWIPNRDRLKFVMIADPIEYQLAFVSNVTIQRSSNDGGKAYSEAVNSWLRGNPDFFDLGEIRDLASGQAAITVGEVGCLGIATVHAHSAFGIVQRLTSPQIGIDLFALTAPKMVSLFVYQALVPKLCHACRIPFAEINSDVRSRMEKVAEKYKVDMSKTYYRAQKLDCPHCKGRGTKGVTVVAEMIDPTENILKLLRENKVFEASAEWKKTSDGKWDSANMTGKEIFAHAFYKAQQGIIDPRYVEERFQNYGV